MHKSLECWQRFECSCSANSSHISNCDRFCTAFMMKSIFYNKEAVRIWKCEGKTIKGLIRMFCYVELIIFLNKKSSISQCINVLLRLGEKFRRLNASEILASSQCPSAACSWQTLHCWRCCFFRYINFK